MDNAYSFLKIGIVYIIDEKVHKNIYIKLQ